MIEKVDFGISHDLPFGDVVDEVQNVREVGQS